MKEKILLIDSNKLQRSIMAYALSNEGYEVIQCGNQEEAIPLVEQRDFVLVISEAIEPINPIVLCSKIKKKDIFTPFIILTTNEKLEYKLEAFEAGIDDYITKEFDRKEIMARIKVQIKNKHLFTKEILILPSLKSNSILIVDDSKATRNIQKGILEHSSYKVDEAQDGEDGLLKAMETHYCLIISDLEMPVMNGFQMIEKLRSNLKYKDIPIIVISSRNSEEQIIKAKKLGVNEYITKDVFNQQRLLDAVKKCLEV